jgi:alpha-mannosidase
MCPAETYTAQANVGDLIRSVSQHKNLGEDTTSLLVFGNGDGGGGPLAQMLEKLRRCRGVSNTIGRLPKIKMGYCPMNTLLGGAVLMCVGLLLMSSLRRSKRILIMGRSW